MSKKWSVGARSVTGYVRNENQDRMSYVKCQFGDIYIVSDGMGGHRGGAFAAELTVEILNQCLAKLDSAPADLHVIKTSFEEANRVVYDRGHDGNPDTEGMGATAVVLIVANDRVMVVHVGDSRAYLFTRNNKLKRLTKDHSRVQRMVDEGILSSAEASIHPDASILERAIGASPTVDPGISAWMSMRKGDQILLCSDGLHGYVSDDEIAEILGNRGTPQELTDQLVRFALEKGGEDNITVQLIMREANDGNGIFSTMSRMAIVVPGIMIFSSATAFVITEYWPAALKTQLQAVEGQSKERDAEWLERANKLDQTVESLRIQIVQLNQKIDQLVKAAPSNSVPHAKADKAPKSKKNNDPSPMEKHVTLPPRINKRNTLFDNTADNTARFWVKTSIGTLAINEGQDWIGK